PLLVVQLVGTARAATRDSGGRARPEANGTPLPQWRRRRSHRALGSARSPVAPPGGRDRRALRISANSLRAPRVSGASRAERRGHHALLLPRSSAAPATAGLLAEPPSVLPHRDHARGLRAAERPL